MSKVILVTGASSGLGQAIAEELAQNHTVYGTSRSKKDNTGTYKMIALDVRDESSISSAVEEVISKEGRLDVVINNAGLGIAGPVEELDIDKMKTAFDTNVFGIVRICRQTLQHLRASKGKMINISSIGSMFGLPYRSAYCASKAGLNMINETLRMELKQFGVQSTAILAGDIQTNINQNRLTSVVPEDSPYHENFVKVYEGIDKDVDSGVTPEYIAKRVAKLVNQKSLKRTYAIGKPLQKLSLTVKKIVPDFIFEKIIRTYSNL